MSVFEEYFGMTELIVRSAEDLVADLGCCVAAVSLSEKYNFNGRSMFCPIEKNFVNLSTPNISPY